MVLCFSAADLLHGPLLLLWSSVCHTNVDEKATITAAAMLLLGVFLDFPTCDCEITKQESLARFLSVFDAIMTTE